MQKIAAFLLRRWSLRLQTRTPSPRWEHQHLRSANRDFMKRLLSLGLLLSFFSMTLAPLGAGAQTVPQSFFGGLHWRLIGPFRAGRSISVSGVPGQPERFYFGAVGGGIWRTDNAGRTWTPIFDSQDVASIGAIAV